MARETYVSTDIESDGPIPVVVVVASLAAAVVLEQARDIHVVTLPVDTSALHAKLEALADGRTHRESAPPRSAPRSR